MLWSETGYFGLLGNNYILFIILLYLIEREMFIGLKKFIWEDPIGTTVSLGRFSYPYVLQYLLYEIRYFGRILTMIYVRTWNHTLNNVRFLVSNLSKEHRRLIT